MSDEEDTLTKEYFKPPTGKALIRKTAPGYRKIEKTEFAEGAVYKIENGRPVLIKAPKVKPRTKPKEPQNIAITPGFYRSLDGRRIRVWYVNNKSDKFPVVGAIETRGVWEPRVWNLQGWTKEPFGEVNNIVAQWSEG